MPVFKSPERYSPWEGVYAAAADFTIGAEAANAVVVTTQLQSGGKPLYSPAVVTAYLSDSSTGIDVAASAPDGGWAVGTGKRLWQTVTNVAGVFQTNTTGVFSVTITESTAKTFYVVVVLPDGSTAVSDAVTFA